MSYKHFINYGEANDYFQSSIFKTVSPEKLEICIGAWKEIRLPKSDSTFCNSS